MGRFVFQPIIWHGSNPAWFKEGNMTFISYAQNFEDVMLWRALKHIENGFYIDAGAWSPDEDSVTRAFYERGWRGINIEPNPFWHEKLLEKRPEDINLPVALGDKEEDVNLYVVVDTTGLSTTTAEYAEKNQADGRSIQAIQCRAVSLNKVWYDHVGKKQVHFLKIDVEGAEEPVLRGNDWTKNRPWIVIIESVFPNTKNTTHDLWERFLIDADYAHAYSDGINRYYIAREHSDLLPAFAYPPNIYDGFKLSAHVQADASLNVLSRQHEDLSLRYQELSRQHQALEARYLTAIHLLSELRKTRWYRLVRRLKQWEWLDREILNLTEVDHRNMKSSS
jgi:FkbM family methyltransferase